MMKVIICIITQRKVNFTTISKATWKPPGDFYLLYQARTWQTAIPSTWVYYTFQQTSLCQVPCTKPTEYNLWYGISFARVLKVAFGIGIDVGVSDIKRVIHIGEHNMMNRK